MMVSVHDQFESHPDKYNLCTVQGSLSVFMDFEKESVNVSSCLEDRGHQKPISQITLCSCVQVNFINCV